MTKTYFYKYSIDWFNELLGDGGEMIHEKGIISAKNFTEAAQKIIDTYGEKETDKFEIEFLSDNDVLVVRDKMLKMIEKDNEW